MLFFRMVCTLYIYNPMFEDMGDAYIKLGKYIYIEPWTPCNMRRGHVNCNVLLGLYGTLCDYHCAIWNDGCIYGFDYS